MSQNAVGSVYEKIIDQVCEQSQVDFEEGGIDQGTLELLKKGWRKKLSELRVAQLPWDPNPATSSTQHAGPGTSHSIKQQQPVPLPSNAASIPTPPSVGSSSRANDTPRIKGEPGSYTGPIPPSNAYPMPPMLQIPPGSVPTAQQIAAINLQQRFGQQAAQQVSQLHQQSGQPRPQNFPTAPYPKSEDQKPLLSSLTAYSPTIPQNSNPAVKIAQNDGAGDAALEWDAMTAEARTFAAQNPGYADRMMRDHLIQVQNQLEGGGLLIPLDEKPASRKARKRKITQTQEKSISDGQAQSESGLSKSSLVRAQGDAAADEEDAQPDEDAINSDLDDSDDREGEEGDQENTDQMMLCTYDKVQRVKNKWKCTLKDGIVRVGGKDYVFHKGQGEFEW